MNPSRVISDGALARMRQTAIEAWRRQDYPQYFTIMEQAGLQHPGNVELLLEIGSAYGSRYDYAAAERWFAKAVEVSPSKGSTLVMAGTQSRGFDRYEMARHYFEQAISLPPVAPDTFVKLAEIYERFRLLDQAVELADRALKLDANCALASLVRARLDRVGGRPADVEQRLRPLLARTDKDSWSTRIRGWYEMGTVLDAQGRYDEAMTAFLAAKTMILPNAARHIANQKQVQARLKITAEKLTPAMIGRWRAQAAELGPPQRLALLGGHPRSGTTLLEQVLDAHPDFVSIEETPIFLMEGYLPLLRGLPPGAMMQVALESASAGTLRRSRQNYMECMGKFLGRSPGGQILIDKNPSLTGLIPGFFRVFPEAKFLVALRDPRDVCLSCFMQPLPLGQSSATFLTLEGAAHEYIAVMGLWRAVAKHLQGSFLEVRYEDLVGDLEGTARRTLAFLGAPWDDRVLHFDEHARQKLVRSPTYAAVAKPISRGALGRWRNYQKYLEPWLETLSPLVQAFGYEPS